MIGANHRAPNAITKNALSRLTSYEAITAALAELRNSLGFDSWNGLIALSYGPQTEKHSARADVFRSTPRTDVVLARAKNIARIEYYRISNK
jgi:hypothetical protein